MAPTLVCAVLGLTLLLIFLDLLTLPALVKRLSRVESKRNEIARKWRHILADVPSKGSFGSKQAVRTVAIKDDCVNDFWMYRTIARGCMADADYDLETARLSVKRFWCPGILALLVWLNRAEGNLKEAEDALTNIDELRAPMQPVKDSGRRG
jgi:hypothetical protein